MSIILCKTSFGNLSLQVSGAYDIHKLAPASSAENFVSENRAFHMKSNAITRIFP